MSIIKKTHKCVSIKVIDNNNLNDVPIVTDGGLVETSKGNMISIFHQYSYIGKVSSIHLSAHME